MQPQDIAFDSNGTQCRGYLYRPEPGGREKVPCVVMAHGFGATRDAGLAPFAEAFCAAGYAVFVFDYRHFGASAGAPRQVLLPSRELEDWLSALAFVRGLDGIDPGAIGLWGTSFSGGLVTVAAARDGQVQAIVAQCPMMDGLAAVNTLVGYAGVGQLIRLGVHGLRDVAHAVMGREPHYIASAGHPGELAIMTAHDCHEGYLTLLPEGAPNKVAARVVMTLMFFRPVRAASRVRCPALIQICETDTLVSQAAAEKTAARMPAAELRYYPCGHFDIYHGEMRVRAIADQLVFLRTHLISTSG